MQGRRFMGTGSCGSATTARVFVLWRRLRLRLRLRWWHHRRGGGGGTTGGFTIVEMLVVIAIVGILFSMAIASFTAWRNRNNLDIARRNIESTLRLARSKSLASEDGGTYGVLFANLKVGIYEDNTYRLCKNPYLWILTNQGVEYLCNGEFSSPSETISVNSLPSNIAFCDYPGLKQQMNITEAINYASPWGVFPTPIFSRLTGSVDNLDTGKKSGTLYIYDTSRLESDPCNGTNPDADLKQCMLDGTCEGIIIYSSGIIETKKKPPDNIFAYVIDQQDNKFKVYDVTDPASPSKTASEVDFTPFVPEKMTINGGYAYVISSSDTVMKVLDLTDIGNGNITALSDVTIANNGVDIASGGDYVYVLSDTGATGLLERFNVSNPADINLPGTSDKTTLGTTGSNVTALSVIADEYAFVTDGTNASVYKINIKTMPSSVNGTSIDSFSDITANTFTNPQDIEVQKIGGEYYAYIYDADYGGIFVSNMSNSPPTYLGSLSDNIYNSAGSVAIFANGNYLFNANSDSSYDFGAVDVVADPKNLAAPQAPNTFDDGTAESLFVYDDFAYLPVSYLSSGTYSRKLKILDVSGLDDPAIGIAEKGDVCLDGASCADSPNVKDVYVAPFPFENPKKAVPPPKILAFIVSQGDKNTTNNEYRFHVINIKVPLSSSSEITVSGSPGLPYVLLHDEPWAIDVDDRGYVYIAYRCQDTANCGNKFTIVNASKVGEDIPIAPTLVYDVSVGGPQSDIAVANNRLYVLLQSGMIKIYDISNTINMNPPPLLASVNTPGGTDDGGIFAFEDYAYAVNVVGETLSVIDPIQKKVVCSVTDLNMNDPSSVYVRKDSVTNKIYAYVADWDTGVVIFDVTDAANGNCQFKGVTTDGMFGNGHMKIDGSSDSTYVYVVDMDDYLNIVDISNPVLPTTVKSIPSQNTNNIFGVYYYDSPNDNGLIYISNVQADSLDIYDTNGDPPSTSNTPIISGNKFGKDFPWEIKVVQYPFK